MKISGANFQKNGSTNIEPCIMTMLRVTCRLLCGSCWLLRTRQSPHRSFSLDQLFFPIPQDEIDGQISNNWQCWKYPVRIAGRDEDAEMKCLPAVPPIIEIPLETLYQCRRELRRRGWRRI